VSETTLETEIKGGFDTILYNGFIEEIAARTAASASGRFAAYLRTQPLNEYFESDNGFLDKVTGSIGVFRQRGKNPVFMVRAGLGIPGSLNFLAGLYRGKTKKFEYTRKRDLLGDGWKSWGGEGRLEAESEAALERLIAEAEKRGQQQ